MNSTNKYFNINGACGELSEAGKCYDLRKSFFQAFVFRLLNATYSLLKAKVWNVFSKFYYLVSASPFENC